MVSRNLTLLFFLFCLVTFVASCSNSSQSSWTILIYLDGDNDLAQANIEDMREMQSGTTNSNIRILVQFDQPNNISAKRFEIKQGVTTELEDIGEVNMAKAQTLTDFLVWAKTKDIAQSEHLMLILSDHGNGWDQGVGPSPSKTLSGRSLFVDEDNGTGITPVLHNHSVRSAIEDANLSIDILGLDASIMGTIEALYEFSDLADIIISSQEVGHPKGWDYQDILNKLGKNDKLSPESFAKVIVQSYRDFFEETIYPTGENATDQRFSIAAHRGNKIKALVDQIDALAQQIILDLADTNTQTQTVQLIQDAISNSQQIDLYTQFNVYLDMTDLVKQLDENISMDTLLNEATIAEYHGKDRENAHGISIVFFQAPEAWDFNTCDANYKNWNEETKTGNKGKFINETHWDELLADYYKIIIPNLGNYDESHTCNTLFQ